MVARNNCLRYTVTMDFNDELTVAVKNLAKEQGFARVAIASAEQIDSAQWYRDWLKSGFQADMGYLEENLDKRLCPAKLVDSAKSVICLAVCFSPADDCKTPDDQAFIARYARGRDYHKVLKSRAQKLCDVIRQVAPEFQGRAFVDTAPVAERALAAKSGLGWIGRSGALIVPGLGSYVVLAEIICNLPLRPGRPHPGGCGGCFSCVAACPTGAIVQEKIVDCRLCLSYQTIENRGKIPRELWGKLGNRVFGCDSCLTICPHNRPEIIGDAEFFTNANLEFTSLGDILRWTPDDWDNATRSHASRRATYEMYLRNAAIAAGNSGDVSLIEPLETLRTCQPQLAEEIDWALQALRLPE